MGNRITNRDMTCVYCGAPNDAATGPTGDDMPKPGDIVLCFACGELSSVTDKATREVTEIERIELLKDPDIQRALAIIKTTPHERLKEIEGWEEL